MQLYNETNLTSYENVFYKVAVSCEFNVCIIKNMIFWESKHEVPPLNLAIIGT